MNLPLPRFIDFTRLKRGATGSLSPQQFLLACEPGSDVYKSKLIDLVRSQVQGSEATLVSGMHMKPGLGGGSAPNPYPLTHRSHLLHLALPSLSSHRQS